uniref:Uncharacterized protein n=1 Tax=Romanomermis culicivorax TaxID=13658 RepID=A0A915J7B3_ROMCU
MSKPVKPLDSCGDKDPGGGRDSGACRDSGCGGGFIGDRDPGCCRDPGGDEQYTFFEKSLIQKQKSGAIWRQALPLGEAQITTHVKDTIA